MFSIEIAKYIFVLVNLYPYDKSLAICLIVTEKSVINLILWHRNLCKKERKYILRLIEWTFQINIIST